MKIWLYFAAVFLMKPAFSNQTVELLHWWTSSGEEAAFSVVEKVFDDIPETLKSEPIVGGGGAPAKTILQAKAIAGTPPDIAQMEGPSIQSWAALGFLHELDIPAAQYRWDSTLYPEIQSIHKYKGVYVAIPINIHRLNWMWANKKLLDAHGIPLPTNWEALLNAFMALKNKGVKPLAIGDEPWQIVQIFENIAYGVGGADYYRRAFVDLEPLALNSKETAESLKRFREIATIVGNRLPKLTWNQATDALLDGEYAFQLTGDWALGEMIHQYGGLPDFIECAPFPSTGNGYIYNIDSLAFFKTAGNREVDISMIAATLSSPNFLIEFSRKKGSIPALHNVSVDELNRCQQRSFKDFNQASESGTAIPSFIDSMAVNPTIQNAVSKELYHYFLDSSVSATTIVSHLNAINVEKMR
ncbi:ABC transporter substrate-binding protein [Photobacterium minamisatsumaniensis]|uniref:ABC transporter substrate-binding protein n=1 Tax=Photobacterium minamisatsumaniensis TaxID=2910233 RepID=UPI003D0BDC35